MGDEKEPDPQTRSSSLRSYASRVFKESSVGPVSGLANTDSTRRRIFKVLALTVCLIGFLYQTGEFLHGFFGYPTSVNIDIVRPNLLTVPGFTFCDNNGINRRIFCEKYPDRCQPPDEAFCKRFEFYCDGSQSLVPKKEYYNLTNLLSLEEMIELNVNITSFVELGHWNYIEEISEPFLRMKKFNELKFLCYSLHDRVNNSLLPRQTIKNEIIKEPVSTLTFDIRPTDMFLPGNRAGILFAIHSPFRAANPYETGVFMKPGRTYMVFVSMEEEHLLQDPYDTNCVNYTERWEKNGYIGPRVQDMCKQDCVADISVQCFNCVVPVIHFPRQERYCEPLDMMGKQCPDNVNATHMLNECHLRCRDDCQQIKYSYNIQERFSSNINELGEISNETDHKIKVEVYVEGDEVMVFRYTPKYMFVEVFSNIGGFIGCWLGINLLDITDIFEGFFRIFRYSWKR